VSINKENEMPTTKLTQKTVDRLPAPDPSGKQVLHFDQDLRGFAVLCSGVSNARTYICQRAVNGKSRRVTVGAANEITLAEARERASRILDDLRQGKDPKAKPAAAPMTLRDALEGYLSRRADLRPRTRDAYRWLVQGRLSAWLDLPLGSITREMVEERHARMAAEVARGGRHSGHASANGTMRVLRLIYNDAMDRDSTLPQVNPVRLRKQWFKQPPRERSVEEKDLPAFHAAVRQLDNPIARDYILLLLFTGLRRREAACLTWDHVDFDRRLIRIPAEAAKSGQRLDLPMSRPVHDLLIARRAIGRDKFVFPGNGRSGHIEEIKSAFARVAEVSGIPVSAHDMRRTFTTVAESTDISPLALKALINHSLGRGVTEGYIQMTVERLRKPAELVGERMTALCEMDTLPEDVTSIR
jgi:integrase